MICRAEACVVIDAKNKILQCDGAGIKEMFVYEKPFTDGIFHLEWRFRKVDDPKEPYNSGVYVRSPNGTHWVQCQVAHLEKPPFLGDLFADIPAGVRVDGLPLPRGLPEQEVVARVTSILRKNRVGDDLPTFLGGGLYDHFVPASVRAIAARTASAPSVSTRMSVTWSSFQCCA